MYIYQILDDKNDDYYEDEDVEPVIFSKYSNAVTFNTNVVVTTSFESESEETNGNNNLYSFVMRWMRSFFPYSP